MEWILNRLVTPFVNNHDRDSNNNAGDDGSDSDATDTEFCSSCCRTDWMIKASECVYSINSCTASRSGNKGTKYYHLLNCTIFITMLTIVLLAESLSVSTSTSGPFVVSQRTRSLYSMTGNATALRPPNVIHFGNSNMIIVLKQRLDTMTMTTSGSDAVSQDSSASVPSGSEEAKAARLSRDDEYFVPFNCPCGSSVATSTTATASSTACQTFECCVCQLKCPLSAVLSNNSYYDKAEWVNQFVRDNCPRRRTPATISFEDRLLYHGGFAKKFWACSQPSYFLNKIHSTWFPYFCVHTDNLASLGSYYEKHSKLGNLQTNVFRHGFHEPSSQPRYNWKHERIQQHRPNEGESELSSGTAVGNPEDSIVHELLLPAVNGTNSMSRIKILGGSKCFRTLGLLRPGLSSYLPCIAKIDIDSSADCDEIRHDLDSAVELLLDIHLKTESSNASFMAQAQAQGFQVQRSLVTLTGIFAHEAPASGERSLHCSNLTLGVEVAATFYNGRPIGVRINYMKRDDQFVSPCSARRLHITTVTSDVNKTLVSRYSRFWSNILNTECPADYCWRDLLHTAKPVVESAALLLPHEAELFMLGCLGGLGAFAIFLLHEFMRNDVSTYF